MNNYRCPVTNKTFGSLQLFEQHIQGMKNLIGEDGDARIIKRLNDSLLSVDEDKHEDENIDDVKRCEEYKCEFCGEIRSNKYNLARHVKTCKKAIDSKQEDKIIVIETKLSDPYFQGDDDNRFVKKYAPYGSSMPPVASNPLTEHPELNGIRLLIDKDNWLSTLYKKCGGIPEAYRFAQACFYRKSEGDADMFQKICLEGKSPDKFPFKILSERSKRLAYINQQGKEVTMGAYKYVQGCIRSNVLSVYLILNNLAINAHIDRTDTIFTHDYSEWQLKLADYVKSGRKEKMMMSVLSRVRSLTNEY
jgi:hypothetical protein